MPNVDNLQESLSDEFVSLNILKEEHKKEFCNTLLLKHIHQQDKEFQRQLNSGEKKQLPFVKSQTDLRKKTSNADFKDTSAINISNLTTKPSSSLLPGSVNQSQANIPNVDSKLKVKIYLLYIISVIV